MGETPLKTTLLLCGASRLDTEGVRAWLLRSLKAVTIHIVPDLCGGPEVIGPAVRTDRAQRLVLGVCSLQEALGEFQREARKAGLDPLGLAIVPITGSGGPEQTERIGLLLAAAVARARAFTGSAPENLKPYLREYLTRRSLLSFSFLEYHPVPSLHESRCVAEQGCNLCVQACPRQALHWSEGKVFHNKSACEPCGLCVTACPREALVDPTTTPAQIEAQVRTLLDDTLSSYSPRRLLFTCQRNDAADPLQDAWLPVSVPCAGMVPPSWLMAALALGASQVGALPCPKGCPNGQEEAIRGRVSYCRALLRLLGAPPERVALDPAGKRPAEAEAVRGELKDPFGARSATGGLLALAEHYRSPDLSFEHPFSPLGVIEVDEAVCTACGRCALACPTGALAVEKDTLFSLAFDPALCVACGQCLPVCPEKERGAIRLSLRTDLALLRQGKRTLYQQEMVRCAACGGPIAPARMLERIEALLGPENSRIAGLLRRYCLTCRGPLFASWPQTEGG